MRSCRGGPRTATWRKSRPGSTTRAFGWPRCGSCPTTSSASSRPSTHSAPGHDYVFTTGGIGPTHDDITVDAIAAAFGVPVVIHPDARKILEDYYRDRPGGLNEARLRMARVPEGAELIPNPSSGAPGVKLGNVYIMAGVPHIAASMLEALTGKLEGGRPMVSVTVGARAPGERGRRPAARDRGRASGRRDRQLSVLQGRPLRLEFRDPVRGRRAARRDAGRRLPRGCAMRATSRSRVASSHVAPAQFCQPPMIDLPCKTSGLDRRG